MRRNTESGIIPNLSGQVEKKWANKRDCGGLVRVVGRKQNVVLQSQRWNKMSKVSCEMRAVIWGQKRSGTVANGRCFRAWGTPPGETQVCDVKGRAWGGVRGERGEPCFNRRTLSTFTVALSPTPFLHFSLYSVSYRVSCGLSILNGKFQK